MGLKMAKLMKIIFKKQLDQRLELYSLERVLSWTGDTGQLTVGGVVTVRIGIW